MTARFSTRPDSPKIQRQLDLIEHLDDQEIRRVLVELAGSMFLTLALQILDAASPRSGVPILDKRVYPSTDRAGREAVALERIGTLTEDEALGVLVSLTGLKSTGRALETVAVA